jgi:hypothetical protein
MVRKYSNQLEEGKIPDFHLEKKGPENFPYVGGKEEILWTREKSENKKVHQFSPPEKLRTRIDGRSVFFP